MRDLDGLLGTVVLSHGRVLWAGETCIFRIFPVLCLPSMQIFNSFGIIERNTLAQILLFLDGDIDIYPATTAACCHFVPMLNLPPSMYLKRAYSRIFADGEHHGILLNHSEVAEDLHIWYDKHKTGVSGKRGSHQSMGYKVNKAFCVR